MITKNGLQLFAKSLGCCLEDINFDISIEFIEDDKCFSVEIRPFIEYLHIDLNIPFYNRKVAGFWSILYDKITGR